MNCTECTKAKVDLQTGDSYCKEKGCLVGQQECREVIPKKCINCVHHRKTESEFDYCDYTEYYKQGIPVPYPYFFKQEYPCKGHEESQEG